jgi:hypothetical protein
MMTDTPIATLCVAADKQNNVFDVRITGVKNPDSVKSLETQLAAARFERTSTNGTTDSPVCTFECNSGNIIQAGDETRTRRAVIAAGMQIS